MKRLPGLLAQFSTFVQRVPPDGCAIIGLDNRGSAFIAKNATVPKLTFATRGRGRSRRARHRYEGLGSRFTLGRPRYRARNDRAARTGRDQRAERARGHRCRAHAEDRRADDCGGARGVSRRATALRDRRRAPRRHDRRRLRTPPDGHRADDRRARASPASRSSLRFSRIATHARATSPPILPMHSPTPMRCCWRRFTPPPKNRSTGVMRTARSANH